MTRRFAVLAIALLCGGCYHANVVTGKPASGRTVSTRWAHAFLAGLIPPRAVETAAECPNGVARVETRQSPLNVVATVLTFGIYSPMTIEASCAAGGTEGDADVVETRRELEAALESGEAFLLKIPTS
jgi:hypothetical protein